MSADILGFDPIKSNAYSDTVRFDMKPSIGNSRASSVDLPDPSAEVSENPELALSSSPSRNWEVDVRGLIATPKWLANYGLKKNRLDMFNIMPQIGFKHKDDFCKTLKRPVSSRYAQGMFQKYLRSDGKTFNVSCSKEKLRQLEQRLSQAIALYKRRLEWLTTESRRVFGVIEERSVCIVLDIKNMSPQQFNQYRSGMERVIKEQISQLAKFNLIRATEDLNCYRDQCVAVSSDSINGAVKWLWALSRTAAVSTTSTCEAVLKATQDNHVEAVFLYTEGSSSDSSREILKEKLTGSRVPLHVVSFNCTKADTIKFLKNLAKITAGRFHAYAVVMEMDSYEANNKADPGSSHANVILKKKTYGGVPPGAGMREDVILVFEELEEARNTLNQLQTIITGMPDSRTNMASDPRTKQSAENLKNASKPGMSERSDTYLSSREWLNKYGLRAKKLGFYDVLANVAFKHRDGVVELKQAPGKEYQTDAVRCDKLINARYCDRFPCVRWKDGQVVHVQVTPDMHRSYAKRMGITLNAVQQRIDWLQQGSRELFGTVIEDQIYLLIDTSASMAPHIQFVKDKLFVLMQEQLRHKQKFNLIAFDTNAASWQSQLVDVNEKNLHQAWQWIKGLTCRGSTNTLAAVRQALSDPHTQAIYLLTDGRPDQPPKSILAQVQLHPQVPIHTISFNCSDLNANTFLSQLAKDTAGRFHYYSENGVDPEGPEPWESEDIRLLRLEIETGSRNLEKIGQLRDECGTLAWKKDEGHSHKKLKDPLSLSLNSSDFLNRSSNNNRPGSASGVRFSLTPQSMRCPRPATATSGGRPRLVVRPQNGGHSPRSKQTKRPLTAGGAQVKPSPEPQFMRIASKGVTIHPLSLSCPDVAIGSIRSSGSTSVAGHTKTSLLRTLNSGSRYGKEWLLPETKEMFDNQWARQQRFIQDDEPKLQKRNRQKKKIIDPLSISSKKWLSRNGLNARKLTILDALAPTIIPHEPTYVPILNKHVLSKVFDDILPIAHASGNRKRIRIVNPQGVNLEGYIVKVKKAEECYRRRLDVIVWNALPDSFKAEHSDGPISYMEHRQEIDKALSEADSPLQERDIIALESEIRQAQIYAKQAQDLIDTSKVKKEDDGEAHSDSDSSAGSRSEKKKVTTTHPRRMSDLMKGQRVIGRNAEDGFYYPGSVVRHTDMRHCIVECNMLGRMTVPTRFVIAVSGAISVPHLRSGDYVLARVVNQETNIECYVPGVVQISQRPKYITVVFYTGQKDHFLRSYLVKISKTRYVFMVRYIQKLEPTEVDHQLSDSDDEDTKCMKEPEKYTGSDSEKSKSRTSSRLTIVSRPRSPSPAAMGEESPLKSKSQSPLPSVRSKTRAIDSCSNSDSISRSASSLSDTEPPKKEDIKRSASSLSRSRTPSPAWSQPVEDEPDAVKQERTRLERWQRHLEQMQRDQKETQKKLRKQAHKLEALRLQLQDGQGQQSEEQRRLLALILNESKKDDRTQQWVANQNVEIALDEENGNILVSSGDKGVLISQTLNPDGIIKEMRQTRLPLKSGEEVLARWSDEGWYYRGTVRQPVDDYCYYIEDSVNNLEAIYREDIIADSDDTDVFIEANDTVVALHPNYTFSYAPGVVLERKSAQSLKVRFYDGHEARVARDETYRIPTAKFELDVAYILKQEDKWVGQAVVARNDKTGAFHLGAVRERVGDGQQYVVERSDGQLDVLPAVRIFGPFTKRHPLSIGDHVLGIVQPRTLLYLPGMITDNNGDKLVVDFCNGFVSHEVEPLKCFWLSREYFISAVKFYKERQETIAEDGGDTAVESEGEAQ